MCQRKSTELKIRPLTLKRLLGAKGRVGNSQGATPRKCVLGSIVLWYLSSVELIAINYPRLSILELNFAIENATILFYRLRLPCITSIAWFNEVCLRMTIIALVFIFRINFMRFWRYQKTKWPHVVVRSQVINLVGLPSFFCVFIHSKNDELGLEQVWHSQIILNKEIRQ